MTNILRTPDEIFNQSIVCRDVSVLFKSTLDKMNIRNEFVNEPNHIYNVVYFGENMCYVDIVNGIFKCGINEDIESSHIYTVDVL